MILDKIDFDKVVGEIYKITNTQNGMIYIGQTRSHRLNHNKYRPFGYLGRFTDHIREANSTKKNTSKYLNSALLKYGVDSFTCERIHICGIDELDHFEILYIKEYNSKYPTGYNLTDGGREFSKIKVIEEIQFQPKNPTIIATKCRSDYTKSLISERVKASKESLSVRTQMMNESQIQHYNNKFVKYLAVKVDPEKIKDYIYIINNHTTNSKYVRVVIDKIKTHFVGKYETIEQTYERAQLFIIELMKWQCNQIAGNP